MEKLLHDTCAEAGSGVTWEFIQHSNITTQTVVDDSNIWWTVFNEVTDRL